MVVEESSHEQAAIFSHRHGHKRIANLFAEMRMHVWMSRASSANEALYSAMSVYMRYVLRWRASSMPFTARRVFPMLSSHVATNHQIHPHHQSLSLSLPSTFACPELLSHLSLLV